MIGAGKTREGACESFFPLEEVEEFITKGYWRSEITSDFCDLNARLCPHREALVDSRQRLTWSQVKTQTDRIALGLLGSGIDRGDVVVVQLYNSVELYLIRLACEKAGIILAPVPPTWGESELSSISERAGVKGIIVPVRFGKNDYYQPVQAVRKDAKSLSHVFIVGDDVPPGTVSIKEMVQKPLEKQYAADFLKRMKLSALGCSAIRPTGGTTGLPKFVAEASCARLCTGRVYIKRTGLASIDIIGVFGRLNGGAGDPLAYRGAPQVGAKVVLLEHFTPEAGCRLIEKERLTAVGLVPAMLAQLLRYPDLDRHDFSSLRFILSSTSLLPYEVGLEAEARLGVPIINGYGSTESASLTLGSISQSREARLSSVGRPLDGNEMRLVDEEGVQVPDGSVGEIIVRGPHRTGIFYNDPELTKECWKDGWFHVGDLAKFDHEENVVLVGRKSDLIIRGGQNVYPREVEDILIQHAKIEQAAIVRMPDAIMGEKACAYVVLSPGRQLSFEEMLSFLESKKVAKYKWPERLEIVCEFPMASGEKVNKKILEQDIALKLSVRMNKV